MENLFIADNFDMTGMYFLEHNLQKNKHVDEEELLLYISSIIEAVTINNCIEDTDDEYIEYLKDKCRDMIWLAAKSRFRAKSTLHF